MPRVFSRSVTSNRTTVPPVAELERICGGEGRGSDEPRNVRFLYARLVRKLSIRLTWVLLKLGIGADGATLLGIGVGLVGAVMLGTADAWLLLAGLVLLQLSFVLDYSDGEVARFRGTSGPAGGYLDWIGHYYLPAVTTGALAWGAVVSGGTPWLLAAAGVMVLGLVRVPYSARDHVLLGLWRDDEPLGHDPAFRRAVLARQGGDPDTIDPAEQRNWREGVGGGGLMWRRYTNLGQLLVFPGFVNVVTFVVVVDVVIADGFPGVDSSIARGILLVGLGVIHLLHQLRAAGQSVRILRTLGSSAAPADQEPAASSSSRTSAS
ncbi:MAG: hypothetical protein ACR2NA_01470 [Solirubrobacterales bacterium]